MPARYTNQLIKGSDQKLKIYTFSSGSHSLDGILGGGYPKVRIVEIYGHESSGKTTLTFHAIKSIQSIEGYAVFVDVEHVFDPNYAVALGIDLDRLLLVRSENGNQALEAASNGPIAFRRSSSSLKMQMVFPSIRLGILDLPRKVRRISDWINALKVSEAVA